MRRLWPGFPVSTRGASIAIICPFPSHLTRPLGAVSKQLGTRWLPSSCRSGSPLPCWDAACGRSGSTPMRSMRSPWPTQVRAAADRTCQPALGVISGDAKQCPHEHTACITHGQAALRAMSFIWRRLRLLLTSRGSCVLTCGLPSPRPPFAGQNIRKLVKDGFVIRKPQVIHSRSRARRSAEAKAKGRHTGYGAWQPDAPQPRSPRLEAGLPAACAPAWWP